MIETSDAYKAAITGTVRRMRALVPIRIQSPDLEYEGVSGTQAEISKPEQLYDGVNTAVSPYASLERNYWRLDGTADLVPDDYDVPGEVGYVGADLSGADGSFSMAQTVTLEISGVTTLQAVALAFSANERDGVPSDFTVSVRQGGTAYYTESVTGNKKTFLQLMGFLVYSPDEITVTITKWSLPYRRVRILEIYPGYQADWTEDNVAALTIKMQASISSTTLPYGTCSITVDNAGKIFDPRNRAGLVRSLEERQAIPVFLGVDTEDGTEYVPCGVYFQHDRGWETRDSALTMRWDLVDIIGLLSKRTYVPSGSLPTTLGGWALEMVTQLGEAFATWYKVDPDYASLSVTASSGDVSGKSCGDIIRWFCMATGTFARADQKTGYLTIEPTWSQGNEYNLDNLEDVPTLSANDKLSSIIFKLGSTDYVVSGNTSTSANTLTVTNPFVTTAEKAMTAAKSILSTYGGNKVSITGRGNPSSEIGDVATVELDRSEATTARILSQTLTFSGGVLEKCRMEMLQADGGFLYENREVITQSGAWTAPAGVSELYVILVGGGQGGGHGTSGSNPWTKNEGWNYGSNGSAGKSGSGGTIWYGTISVNEGQSFSVTIGAGGAPGTSTAPTDGSPTTFGSYSSANGRVYSPSFTDVASGSAYGRSGVSVPAANSGDGGKGGSGGTRGAVCYVDLGSTLAGTTNLVAAESYSATAGSYGAAGASGCVIIYYER